MRTRPFKVHERPMDFNGTEYEEFVAVVWDATLPLAFKKLPLVEFWYRSTGEYPRLSEKAGKMLLRF